MLLDDVFQPKTPNPNANTITASRDRARYEGLLQASVMRKEILKGELEEVEKEKALARKRSEAIEKGTINGQDIL